MDMANTPCDMCKGCFVPKEWRNLTLMIVRIILLAMIALVIIALIYIVAQDNVHISCKNKLER